MNTQAADKHYKVALDVGTTKVVAVAGRKNSSGKIEVLGYSKIYNTGVVQGEIFNLLDTATTIRHVKEDMERKFGIEIDRVSVGLSGKHIGMMSFTEHVLHRNFHEVFTPDDLEKLENKIRNAVTLNPDEEILEVIPQSYLIDGKTFTMQPVGAMGRRLEGKFTVVIGNKKKIGLIRQSLEEAGLTGENFYLQSIASAEAVLKKNHMQAGAVLLDIGGGTTDIMIINNGIIRHVGVIPVGGDFITEHISHQLKILTHMAERLKIEYGTALSHHLKDNIYYKLPVEDELINLKVNAKEFATQIENGLDFLSALINMRIQNYEKQFPGEKINAGVFITGGGATLKHLSQYFEYKLGKPATVTAPGMHLAANKFTQELSKPMYATVIGLLKLSLEEENAEKLEQTSERTYTAPEHEPVAVKEPPSVWEAVRDGNDQTVNPPEQVQKQPEKTEEKKKNGGFIAKFLKNISDFQDKLINTK